MFPGQAFRNIVTPELPPETALAILNKPAEVLLKSKAYPYGLTQNLIDRLLKAGIKTVGELAATTDEKLDEIEYIGAVKIKRIRDAVYQSIWM